MWDMSTVQGTYILFLLITETASKEDESLVTKYGFSEPLNARCSGIKKGKLNYPTDMLWRPKRVKRKIWIDYLGFQHHFQHTVFIQSELIFNLRITYVAKAA